MVAIRHQPTLPNGMHCGDNVKSLINFVYPNLKNPDTHSDQFFLEQAILSCRNDDVDDLNQAILSVFPGDLKLYHSSDQIVQEGTDVAHAPVYPVEFLNSLKPAVLPLSKLCLKVGCPLMLLHNLDPSKGLCNGTHIIILHAQPHVLECQVLGGSHSGERVFIPRITLEPSDNCVQTPSISCLIGLCNDCQ